MYRTSKQRLHYGPSVCLRILAKSAYVSANRADFHINKYASYAVLRNLPKRRARTLSHDPACCSTGRMEGSVHSDAICRSRHKGRRVQGNWIHISSVVGRIPQGPGLACVSRLTVRLKALPLLLYRSPGGWERGEMAVELSICLCWMCLTNREDLADALLSAKGRTEEAECSRHSSEWLWAAARGSEFRAGVIWGKLFVERKLDLSETGKEPPFKISCAVQVLQKSCCWFISDAVYFSLSLSDTTTSSYSLRFSRPECWPEIRSSPAVDCGCRDLGPALRSCDDKKMWSVASHSLNRGSVKNAESKSKRMRLEFGKKS